MTAEMNVTIYDLADYGNRYVEVYGVQSQSRAGTIYTVALNKKGVWSCGCPRWTMNRNRPECKHIIYIKSMRGNLRQSKPEKMPEKVIRNLSRFASIEV